MDITRRGVATGLACLAAGALAAPGAVMATEKLQSVIVANDDEHPVPAAIQGPVTVQGDVGIRRDGPPLTIQGDVGLKPGHPPLTINGQVEGRQGGMPLTISGQVEGKEGGTPLTVVGSASEPIPVTPVDAPAAAEEAFAAHGVLPFASGSGFAESQIGVPAPTPRKLRITGVTFTDQGNSADVRFVRLEATTAGRKVSHAVPVTRSGDTDTGVLDFEILVDAPQSLTLGASFTSAPDTSGAAVLWSVHGYVVPDPE